MMGVDSAHGGHSRHHQLKLYLRELFPTVVRFSTGASAEVCSIVQLCRIPSGSVNEGDTFFIAYKSRNYTVTCHCLSV